MGTTLNILEYSTQHANLSEIYVGLTNTSILKDMRKLNAPMVLWDFCAERRMRINNFTDWPLFHIQGQNPHLANFGEEGNISNICKLKWYEWDYAMDGADKFPNQPQLLCRVLGPTKNDGTEMTQRCFKDNGKIVNRRSVVPLTNDQLKTTEKSLSEMFSPTVLGKGLAIPSIFLLSLSRWRIYTLSPMKMIVRKIHPDWFLRLKQ